MSPGTPAAPTAIPRVHGCVLSREPIIIYGREYLGSVLGPASSLAEYLRGRRAYFLISNSWTFEYAERLKRAVSAYLAHEQRYPEHTLIFLCNSAKEVEAFRRQGVRSELLNHNMFVSEEIFRILPDETRQYDAVYNARMAEYKRHFLCSEIESLLLIYYIAGDEDIRYCSFVKTLLPRARFLNGDPGSNYRRLSETEVAQALNACRVGLCLSETEGTMKVSIEYLLCGLPVVTTPSTGGREMYLDDEFCLTAEPRPAAVSSAVRQLVDARIDPKFIREKTLRKVHAERARFVDFVQRILAAEGVRRSFKDDWPRIYTNNLIIWNQEPDEMLRRADLL